MKKFKNIILSILGLVQGTIGTYIALLGVAFAFHETTPGDRDYEEDITFVPFGYLIMIIWLIIMIYAFVSLRKNKANLLSFGISWIVGVIGFVLYFKFYIG